MQSYKLYDLNLIHTMTRGNSEKTRNMIRVFTEQTPQLVTKMKHAYEQKDFQMLNEVAHKMKPTMTYYGVPSLAEDLRLIENLAVEKPGSPLIAGALSHVEQLTKMVVHEMENDFMELSETA